MPISNPSVVHDASRRLITLILVSYLCVTSAILNGHHLVLDELAPKSEEYGTMPNVLTLIDLVANSTSRAAVATNAGTECGLYVNMKEQFLIHTYTVTEKTMKCPAFYKAPVGWKLTFEITGLKLFPCDEEYLYLNDGATLESTLCDGQHSAVSADSRFLYVKFERRTNTGTAFSFTVRAVPRVDTKHGVTIKNALQQQSFTDGHISPECGRPAARARRGRLLNGEPVQVNEYPWMVGIHISLRSAIISNGYTARNSTCGGSILDRRHILTAAHCIKTQANDKHPVVYNLIVVAGSDLGFNEQVDDVTAQIIRADSWFAYPLYDPDRQEAKNYDIAVLRLSKDLHFNRRVAPVCLAAPLDFAGTDVTVTGWGYVPSEMRPARRLQAVKLSVRSQAPCDKLLKDINRNFVFHSYLICLFSPSMDSCGGDSGGPAVIRRNDRFYQVGVVSFGLGCDMKYSERLGGYVRVSSFIPWIKEVINGTTTC